LPEYGKPEISILKRAERLGVPREQPLRALTGQEQMDATAILDYFAPLKKRLDEQNRGKPVGW
jgi:hypothetical protein